MTERGTSTIEVRRRGFAWPDDLDLLPLPGNPEASCEVLALSFTLPYLEPYLIRTMRAASQHIDDPLVAADMKAFSGQEAQHHRQHSRVNDLVRARLSPTAATAMRALEDQLDADYRRFSDQKSLRFNLAYAEGFEAMTFSLARAMMQAPETGGAEPAWRALTLWHLAEEIEHRTVTFDAYDAAFGGWSYRTAVGTWSQGHFLRALVRMAAVCRHDLVPDAATVREAGWYSLKRHTRLGTIGGVVKALSPRYNPRRVPLSDQIVAVAAQQGVSLG